MVFLLEMEWVGIMTGSVLAFGAGYFWYRLTGLGKLMPDMGV